MPFAKWFFLVILCVSCSHQPKADVRIGLFPAGNYVHLAHFYVLSPAQNYQFTGVLNVSSSKIQMYLMTPMNVTALQITEDLDSESVHIQNYFSAFKQYEPHIAEIYRIIRNFIVFPRTESKWGGLEVSRRDGAGRPTLFIGPRDISIEVRRFKDGAPEIFEVRHPKFRVEIEEFPQ